MKMNSLTWTEYLITVGIGASCIIFGKENLKFSIRYHFILFNRFHDKDNAPELVRKLANQGGCIDR